jgi:polysaccharide export outer membrane protein
LPWPAVSPNGHPKKEIILLRKVNGKDKILRINYKKIIKGEDFSHNVKLKADDTIIVP